MRANAQEEEPRKIVNRHLRDGELRIDLPWAALGARQGLFQFEDVTGPTGRGNVRAREQIRWLPRRDSIVVVSSYQELPRAIGFFICQKRVESSRE